MHLVITPVMTRQPQTIYTKAMRQHGTPACQLIMSSVEQVFEQNLSHHAIYIMYHMSTRKFKQPLLNVRKSSSKILELKGLSTQVLSEIISNYSSADHLTKFQQHTPLLHILSTICQIFFIITAFPVSSTLYMSYFSANHLACYNHKECIVNFYFA